MIPSRISLSFNLEMVILDLFNQLIVCVQKSLVNLQCKNKSYRIVSNRIVSIVVNFKSKTILKSIPIPVN